MNFFIVSSFIALNLDISKGDVITFQHLYLTLYIKIKTFYLFVCFFTLPGGHIKIAQKKIDKVNLSHFWDKFINIL